MSATDDLVRLSELHRNGSLSDEEFARAKAQLLSTPAAAGQSPLVGAVNALRRSRSDRWIGGVCGGIARATGVQPWIWRLVTVLLALWGGSGLLLYLLLWLFVPQDSDTAGAPGLSRS